MKFYKVGGCVRDALLNRKAKDVDFVAVLESDDQLLNVEDTPFQFMERALRLRGFDIFTRAPEFGTVRARCSSFTFNGEPVRGGVDFVVARKDIGGDGRYPDRIEFGTLEDDLRRRDFTMNAIAEDSDGRRIDPFDGQQDVKDKVIRTVGDPAARFQEDALRVLRALRFAVTLGFNIHPTTSVHLHDLTRTPGWLDKVSTERVREELLKMFEHDTPKTLHYIYLYDCISALFTRGLWLRPTLEGR